MKESQMFKMDRKLQATQNRYDNCKREYKKVLREMIEKGKIEINGLNTNGFIDKYVEKLMEIKHWKRDWR